MCARMCQIGLIGLTLIVVLTFLVLPGQAAGGVGQVIVTAVEAQAGFPLVQTYLAVTDIDGLPITGLDKTAFFVMENEAEVQEFQVEPYRADMLIAIVIDSSKSFDFIESGRRRVEHAKSQASALVDPEKGRLQPGDRVAVFAFTNGQPTLVLDFDMDHNRVLDQGIARVDTTGNVKTALFDIVRKSVDAIAGPQAYRRVLLLFSDGVDTTSSIEIEKVIRQAQEAHLVIYSVGLGPNLAPDQEGSRFLRRLALETGGQYMWYQPGRANSEQTMAKLLDDLVAQRNIYRLSYQSKQCSGEPVVRIGVRAGARQAEAKFSYPVPEFPPTISLENVSSGLVYKDKQLIKVGVVCSQAPVSKVEFRINDELVYTDEAFPFEFEWNVEDTARQLGATTVEPKEVRIQVRAYAGAYQADQGITVGAVLVPPPPKEVIEIISPCTTGTPFENFVCNLQRGDIGTWLTIVTALVALIAVILLVILIRRGGLRTAGAMALEGVRRATRVFRRRTDIKAPGGVPQSRPAYLACLVMESEPFAGKRIYLDEPNAFLGRVPEKSNIVFDWDDYVSGRHAKIQYESGRFYLWDMSQNGTWVNERRVPRSASDGVEFSEAVELTDGALIRLGPDLKLRFHVGNEQQAMSGARPTVDLNVAPSPSAQSAAPSNAPAAQVLPEAGRSPLGQRPLTPTLTLDKPDSSGSRLVSP